MTRTAARELQQMRDALRPHVLERHAGLRAALAVALIPQGLDGIINGIRAHGEAHEEAVNDAAMRGWPALFTWFDELDRCWPSTLNPANLTDDPAWYQLQIPTPSPEAIQEATSALGATPPSDDPVAVAAVAVAQVAAHVLRNLRADFRVLERECIALGYPPAAEWIAG